MSYYISPRFLDKLAIHITKNFLEFPNVRVPLILGIHGRKGEGKSFQCELVFQQMGIDAVHMSAGELESPDAGDPARLIRLRYREAAEMIRVRGRMCVLMINDLDAGAGRVDAFTQYTVNTQLVHGTLMNIADNPTNVQLPGSYDSTPLHRVPIIVTGNDFSTLYAPLVRDGRMEKFYWEPDRADRLGIVGGIFSPDGLAQSEIEQLVDTFSHQSIDFFGALRSRIYDEQVRDFIHQVGLEQVSRRVVNSKDGPPSFQKPQFNLSRLLDLGHHMVQEQRRIEESRLSEEYNHAVQLRRLRGQAEPLPAPSLSIPGGNSSVQSQGNGSQNPAGSVPMTPIAAVAAPTITPLAAETLTQLRQLLSQGLKIAIETVDQRRFRMNSWQSCTVIQSQQEPDAIAALERCLSEHAGEYVRLVGIEPSTKRRVLESIIQRP